MSLQVWLPLTKDLRNQGLNSNIPTLMGNGITYVSGKIGQAVQFPNNCNSCIHMPGLKLQTGSWAAWIKVLGAGATTRQCIISEGRDSYNDGVEFWTNQAGTTLYFKAHTVVLSATITLNTWYHIVGTFGDGIVKLYIDGIEKTNNTYIDDMTYTYSNDRFVLGKMAYSYTSTGNYFSYNGCLNDVRVYNHVLSQKEIKELAKGLILHYPLNNNGFGQENLIKDSVYNATPWTQGIKQRNLLHANKRCMQLDVGSLYNNTSNGTTTIFPGITFESNTQYTLSWYWRDDLRTDGKNTNFYLRFKYTDGTFTNVISGSDPQNQWTYHTMTSTAGKTVAAICTTYGYGTDKFLLTDLKLEKGAKATTYNSTQYELLYDKKYYRESDGSSWVRIFHHNNPASTLFSSSDTFSTGVYKSADAWYDFEPIMSKLPYYEFMVKQKTTSDASETKYRWIQYKNPLNATWYDVEPNQVTRIATSGYTNLSYAGGIYLRNGSARLTIANTSNGNWYGALGCWTAYQGGIPGFPSVVVTTGFIDLYVRIPDQGIEFDTSGFNYNINKIGSINSSIDTKRYKTSTHFNGTEVLSTASPGADILTISCWAKTSKSKSTSQMIVADSTSKLCCSLYQGTFISFFGGNSDYSTGSKCSLGSEYKENEWNHFVSVKTGVGTRDCYCNGIKLTPTSNDWWSSPAGFWIGNRDVGGNIPFYGEISDVRAYATALSADDIAELYAAGRP